MATDAPPAPGLDRHHGLTSEDLRGLSDADRDLRLYRAMAYVRAFEERVETLYKQGQVRGPAHLALGHEAIAVGVGSALDARDRSIGTYRGHAHALVRGADPAAVMLELLGRAVRDVLGRRRQRDREGPVHLAVSKDPAHPVTAAMLGAVGAGGTVLPYYDNLPPDPTPDLPSDLPAASGAVPAGTP